MILTLFLLSTFLTIGTNADFTGYSFALSDEGLADVHTNIYSKAIKDLKGKSIENISGSVSFLFIKGKFTFKNIKYHGATIDSSIKGYNIIDKKIETVHKNPVIIASFTFDYTFSPFNLFTLGGKGKFSISFINSKMILDFTNDANKGKLEANHKRSLEILDGWFISLFKGSVQNLLDKNGAKEIVNMVLDNIDKETANIFREITNMKVLPTNHILLPMYLSNSLTSLEKNKDNLILFNYDTSIVIEKESHKKTMYRNHKAANYQKTSKAQVCIGVNLLASILEVSEKARPLRREINPINISLSTDASGLRQAMPDLDEHVPMNEKLRILCGSNSDNNIVVLKTKNGCEKLQLPLDCQIYAASSNKTILEAEFIIRGNITIKNTINEYIKVNADFDGVELQTFNILKSIALVKNPLIIQGILITIGRLLEGYKMLPDSFVMKVPLGVETKGFISKECELYADYN